MCFHFQTIKLIKIPKFFHCFWLSIYLFSFSEIHRRSQNPVKYLIWSYFSKTFHLRSLPGFWIRLWYFWYLQLILHLVPLKTSYKYPPSCLLCFSLSFFFFSNFLQLFQAQVPLGIIRAIIGFSVTSRKKSVSYWFP